MAVLSSFACSRQPPAVSPDPRNPFERETDAVRMEGADVLLAGTSVTLKRVGLRFAIPRRWLKPYVDGHPDPANLCVRAADFERANDSDMHFDLLWVADEVVSFETIVCQLRPPYGAFVLRVHLLPEASARATRDILRASREALQQMTAGYRPFRDATGAPIRYEWPVREHRAPWERLLLRAHVWDDDYSIAFHWDYYLRDVAGGTLVFLFAHRGRGSRHDPYESIDAILRSCTTVAASR